MRMIQQRIIYWYALRIVWIYANDIIPRWFAIYREFWFVGGVPPEQEPCIRYVYNQSEALVSSDDIKAEKKLAEENHVALDCLWVITAYPDMRVRLNWNLYYI